MSGFEKAVFDIRPNETAGDYPETLDLRGHEKLTPEIPEVFEEPKWREEKTIEELGLPGVPVNPLQEKPKKSKTEKFKAKKAKADKAEINIEEKPEIQQLPVQAKDPAEELEKLLNTDLDINATLAGVGGKLVFEEKVVDDSPWAKIISDLATEVSVEEQQGLPMAENVFTAKKGSAFKNRFPDVKILEEVPYMELTMSKEKEEQIASFALGRRESHLRQGYGGQVRQLPKLKKMSRKKWWLFSGIILAAGTLVLGYGNKMKIDIVRDGGLALLNLQSAKDNLSKFNFSSASEDFLKAYKDFSSAGNKMNVMGVALGAVLGELPGAGKLKAANKMIEAGKLISDSGQAMSTAMASLSETGSLLRPGGDPVSTIFSSLREALSSSLSNIKKAKALLSEAGPDLIPEEKKETFSKYIEEMPVFEQLMEEGIEYTSFMEKMVGKRGIKKYLLLFQNNSEIRPTGGFIGSYALLTFKDGRMQSFYVDDVYNIDGQLKENIIPPLQLQHITPVWGMRDANWFIDLRESADKVQSFFEKETGIKADGVITVTPDMISKILAVLGPVSLQGFDGLTLDEKNFLAEIQEEVEYGPNRKQPKSILKEFGPKLLEKIYSAKPDEWLKIFQIIMASLDNKDMMMHFNDTELQVFAEDKGFSGKVVKTDSDFLMVTLTNVKGSKTDAVTDNSILFETVFDGEQALHKLVITRKHNGGKTDYGFYNKINYSYVRVLVPENSSFIDITGNSNPKNNPIINYVTVKDFTVDKELSALESSVSKEFKGVTVYKEAGKTGFGFWLITEPGKTRTVTLEYSSPTGKEDNTYRLYVEKQPGLKINNAQLIFKGVGPIAGSLPVLDRIGEDYVLNSTIEKDIPIEIRVN
jgi:hypothetical protein